MPFWQAPSLGHLQKLLWVPGLHVLESINVGRACKYCHMNHATLSVAARKPSICVAGHSQVFAEIKRKKDRPPKLVGVLGKRGDQCRKIR